VPDDDLIPSLLSPPVINTDALKEARARNAGALSTARTERAKARSAYGTSIEDTLRAIDATTNTLREAHTSKDRFNLPAMAFAAGMLKTQPGVASNFLGELSSGLSATVPVIAQQRMSDEQFWKGMAELQAQRGEVASQPSKVDIAAGDKEIDRATQGLNTLEAAAIRGIPAEQRHADAQRLATEKQDAALIKQRQDALTKMESEARADVQAMTKNFEAIQPEDLDAMTQMILHDRIQRYNAQPGLKNKIEVPPPPPQVIERAQAVRAGLEKKGTDERQSKTRDALLKRADETLKSQYPAFSSLPPEAQEALRQKQIARIIDEHNKGLTPKDSMYLPPTVLTPDQWESINKSEGAHGRLVKLGEPTKEDLESNHLPTDYTSKRYANLSYPERQKMLERQDADAQKQIDKDRALASDLASRRDKAKEMLDAYRQSDRTGTIGGMLPNWGSTPAQLMDKLQAELSMTNVPEGQGAISDAERKLISKATAGRSMTEDSVRSILTFYQSAAVRANEKTEFLENWQATHRTLDGATKAWNEYLESKQAQVIVPRKSGEGVELNPRRMSWREYFDRRNKGDLNDSAPAERWERRDGKMVKVTD